MAGRSLPLHTRILIGGIAGIVAGVAVHFLAPDAAPVAWILKYITLPVGQIFLRLLFMLVVPLIFSALVVGVAGMGDPRSLGRIGLKALAYTVVVSGIAVFIGVTLVNLIKPGAGIDPAVKERLTSGAAERAST